jgi:hemin uptake protein HemP
MSEKLLSPSIEQTITIEELMQGKSELTIIHSGQRYMLRITRNGKLILTK